MSEPQRVRKVVSTVLPTAHGTFHLHGYAVAPGREHLALVLGDLDGDGRNGHVPLVRVHSECLTGDALGSWRCDCGQQLDAAMQESVDAYVDPWTERDDPFTPGQFRTSLPLEVLPQVPVR